MEAEFEDRTLEDAIALAVASLGLTQDKFDVEVLESQRGLFSSKKVRIKVRTLESITPVAETDYEHAILDFIRGLLQHMMMDVEVGIKERTDDSLYVNIDSKDASILIGKKGNTLDALQRIVDAVARSLSAERRITLDVAEYRERREEQLVMLAKKVGEKVRRAKRPQTLNLLPPNERRIVHMTIASLSGISTRSLGEENAYYKQIQVFSQQS